MPREPRFDGGYGLDERFEIQGQYRDDDEPDTDGDMTVTAELARVETPAPHPLILLQQMMSMEGVDPNALEKMMDMAERYDDRQAKKAYFEAMAECQNQMPVVVKNATDPSKNGRRYANLEAVTTAVRPVYLANGFSLTFSNEPGAREGYARVVCTCRHTKGHSETHTLDLALDGSGMKGGSNMTALQGVGSTMAYGRRYLTLMIFNVVVSDEDKDGAMLGNLPIGPEQLARLEDEIAARDVDRTAFLNFLGIGENHKLKTLADMPSRDFQKALSNVCRKPTKARAGA